MPLDRLALGWATGQSFRQRLNCRFRVTNWSLKTNSPVDTDVALISPVFGLPRSPWRSHEAIQWQSVAFVRRVCRCQCLSSCTICSYMSCFLTLLTDHAGGIIVAHRPALAASRPSAVSLLHWRKAISKQWLRPDCARMTKQQSFPWPFRPSVDVGPSAILPALEPLSTVFGWRFDCSNTGHEKRASQRKRGGGCTPWGWRGPGIGGGRETVSQTHFQISGWYSSGVAPLTRRRQVALVTTMVLISGGYYW